LLSPYSIKEIIMKTKTRVLSAAIAGVMGLMGAHAQADIVKNAVRLGAFQVTAVDDNVPLTQTGEPVVTFTGSGKFTIWYTAECAAGGYVDVDILVDGIPLSPSGANNQDSFCDFETRGAMHTVTGRTNTLAAGTHTVQIRANTSAGTVGFLSDSSLLIGK
jgi:hypothetical protein